MGVDLASLVDEVKHEHEVAYFSDLRIAFDAFNTLYQFLASIRQPDGTPLEDMKGRITSHLSGLFYRNIRLMKYGIKPIYVFDGEKPKFKEKTVEERIRRKEEAEMLYRKAEDEEKTEDMHKYAQAMVRLTHEMVEESKALLQAMSINVVQAPSEGEAQAAYMAAKGIVDASASQDYDSLLFGSTRLIRNLSITGKRKNPYTKEYITVKPEEIFLKEFLNHFDITREQLIYMGVLIGTDFNGGVKRVGPKTALKIVKAHSTFKEINAYVEEKYKHRFESYIEKVIDFFRHPKSIDVKLEKLEIDEDKIKKILVDEHDFSEDRVEHALRELEESKDRKKQHSLAEWMK